MPKTAKPNSAPPVRHERKPAVDQWLREEVVPVYDAMKADPKSGLPAKAVFAELKARYAKRSPCR